MPTAAVLTQVLSATELSPYAPGVPVTLLSCVATASSQACQELSVQRSERGHLLPSSVPACYRRQCLGLHIEKLQGVINIQEQTTTRWTAFSPGRVCLHASHPSPSSTGPLHCFTSCRMTHPSRDSLATAYGHVCCATHLPQVILIT